MPALLALKVLLQALLELLSYTYNRNTEITGNDFTQQNHYDAEGYRDTVTEKDLHTGNTKTTGFAYQQGMLPADADVQNIYQYVEFDIDNSVLKWIENPRYHKMELTVKGDIKIKNAKFYKRKK